MGRGNSLNAEGGQHFRSPEPRQCQSWFEVVVFFCQWLKVWNSCFVAYELAEPLICVFVALWPFQGEKNLNYRTHSLNAEGGSAFKLFAGSFHGFFDSQ